MPFEPLVIAEEIQPEIEERRRHRRSVDLEVPLEHVPATRTDEQRRHLVVQLVHLAVLLEPDRAIDRVGQVALPVDHVLPRRRVRILEIGHEHLRAAVQRVDHHLAIRRPRDLHAPVGKVMGRGRHPPVAHTHAHRLLEEVRQLAVAQPLRTRGARCEDLLPAGAELALEQVEELDGGGRENVVGGGHRRASWSNLSGDSPRMDASTSSIGWNAGVGLPARRSAAVT